jgi:hypothetical protein
MSMIKRYAPHSDWGLVEVDKNGNYASLARSLDNIRRDAPVVVLASDFDMLETLANEVAFTHEETNKHEVAMIALRKWLREASQSKWECAVAKLRPATKDDRLGAPSTCWNHSGFKNKHRYVCKCSECDAETKQGD